MSLESIQPVLIKSGSPLSLKEFHHQVNVIFHDVESQTYDNIHEEMWFNLFDQFQLLIAQIRSQGDLPSDLTLLDIGCGTGLATEMILKAGLKPFVKKIILADVSPKMLEKAKQRAQTWGVPVLTHLGDIADLEHRADMVVMSSLLHHIPDLKPFLKSVLQLMNSGAFLIHVHDPNGDHLSDPEFLNRKAAYSAANKKTLWEMVFYNSLIVKPIKRAVNKMLGRKGHIELVNDQLFKNGVIKRRLKAKEIWSITDIHVEDLPYSTQKGISLLELKSMMPDCKLIHSQSYGFFGKLLSEMPASFQEKERELMTKGEMNGRYLAAIWVKNS